MEDQLYEWWARLIVGGAIFIVVMFMWQFFKEGKNDTP